LITGRQLRAARALIGWEQAELARRACVAIGTIRRMESFSGEIGSRTSTLSQVLSTLERAGIQFLNSGSPGVRLLPVSAPERGKDTPAARRRG
jgi:predicted transcriptional regulator